ncbi:MAG: efflux RND transporter permease subunit [Chitinispirillaceae bacterium]|nr:efflux RND transporter permease subunit [Chitinispirillaceae bacterium]
MRFSSLFINRPVLAMVCNILIVLSGLIGASFLGVRDYPALDPPIITVRTSYPGANPDVIESQITEPLEASINGIAGIRTLTSSSAEGSSMIRVEFNLDIDLEAAANDVRDRVSRAMRNLPRDADPPVVIKADADASPIIIMSLNSGSRTPLDLTDYATNVVKERLQTIPEVSEVRIWGEKRYAMRLWFNPLTMASAGVTAQDIKAALDRENIELPSGRIEGLQTELSIRTLSGLREERDFNDLIIKQGDGRIVRLRDIGRAELGPENERSILKRDGVPMVNVAVVPQPGANHIDIADQFYARYESLKKELPPDISSEVLFDKSKTVRASIVEVIETIGVAFILVMLVIFAFLRTWRATLIPMLAIPISLVGAFFIMYVFGFSINILTLLAIVLATGLVVDDAIVVLENIYVKIEKGVPPMEAGHKGTSEIFFAVIATTLSIVAVLLPVIFLQGLTGRLFREFGLVLAGAIALSSFVSLTLTPVLCTRILRRNPPHAKTLYSLTEPFFHGMIVRYRQSLDAVMKRRWIGFPLMLAAVGIIALIYPRLKSEIAPLEDRSGLAISVTAPEGTSYEQMNRYLDLLYEQIRTLVPEHTHIIQMIGGFAGVVNTGSIRVFLSDPSDRKRSQQEIAAALSREFKKVVGVRAVAIQEQTIATGPGRRSMPVQFVLQAPNLEKLRDALPQFIDETTRSPLFSAVDVNMKFNKPELRVYINRDKARDLQVSALDLAQTLQLSLSANRYGYFIRENNKQYQIIGQFERSYRDKPGAIMASFVSSGSGKLVRLDNLVSFQETSTPPQIFRFNRFVSATVMANPAPDRTLGEGIEEMRRIGEKVLDESFSTSLAGPSRDFAESSSSVLFAFALALVFVYLVLAAQFESFRSPLVVMTTVPLALAGALLSLWYFNQTLNIFSQIGMIMLVGLVAKNGILIVEFANQRRTAGMGVHEAIVDAAASRLRPILMTSLTVALGVLPIALAIGASARSRVSMGIAIIGGILFSLFLSLYVVPAVYTYIASGRTTPAAPKIDTL